MFLIDKYRPDIHNKYDDEYIMNMDVIDKLRYMSKDDSIPNILFYGTKGTGKKTCIKYLLNSLFDKSVNKTKHVTYSVNGSGNKPIDVVIKQSDYHIEIDPNNNNFDKYIIQDIVLSYAKRLTLNIYQTNRNFKCVVINKVNKLSYYAQTSLRRTMEQYSNNCRFILWCESLSSVIDPLRSRCICIRVSAPTSNEMFSYLYKIAINEGMKINNINDIRSIVKYANGNIKKGLWKLELRRTGSNYIGDYDETIMDITKLIIDKQIDKIYDIRNFMYNIMITNIEGTIILQDILKQLILSNIPDIAKYKIIELASTCEHNLVKGRREIMHLDCFVIGSIKIINDI